MDYGVIITAVLGGFTTFISAWVSWFFAREKYNSEVDSNVINNMKESLDFYEKLSTDNKERLEEVLKRNSELEQEVKVLKRQMLNFMNTICTDLTCQLRQRNINLFNENYGVSDRQKVEDTNLYNQ